jgi:AraC family transcriptional regulator
MAHLHPNVRYRGCFVSITDVRCRPSTCRLSGEEQAEIPEIVFPRTGVFIKHTGRQQVVGDANHVLFFNANEIYRVSHPGLEGDDCTSFEFAASIAAEAIDVYPRVVGPDLQRPYRRSHGLLKPQTIIRQQQLRQRLKGPSASALEIEELALQLLNDVLADVDCQTCERQRRRQDTVQLRRRWIETAKLLIAERPEAKLSLAEISRKVYCSPFHLSRIFRAMVGSSIHQYQLRLRLALALDRLADGAEDLTELGLGLGFSSHSHFTTAFQHAFGLSPSGFRGTTTSRRIRKLSKILKA